MQDDSAGHDVVRFDFARPPRRPLVIFGILMALITFVAFMDLGLTKRYVILLAILATSFLLLIATLRVAQRGYVEVSRDRLTHYNGFKRRTIRLSGVVGVGFGWVRPAIGMTRARVLTLDLMQRDVRYGVHGAHPYFPRRKDLGENGRDAKHFALNVTLLDRRLFNLIIPPLLNNPNVYVAPQARAALERIVAVDSGVPQQLAVYPGWLGGGTRARQR